MAHQLQSQGARVVQGLCGFNTSAGVRFYPSTCKTTEQRLAHYA
jgi:hypothetical protein